MGTEFRPIDASDQCGLAAAQLLWDVFYSRARLIRKTVAEVHRLYVQTGDCYGAIVDDALVGVAALQVSADREFATLDLLAVEPTHRERRIGSSLLRFVEGQLQEASVSELHVHVPAPPVREFYRKQEGYVPIGDAMSRFVKCLGSDVGKNV